jgi:DNA-binding XRE family transcriptional regulator
MQTSTAEDTTLSERRLQLSTHLRPAASVIVSRASHTRPRSLPELPGQLSADSARDVSSRFGARLRELRRERNLTQLRMANDFGIDRSFISDVERGRKSISLPMLEVIALGMKMTLSELLRDI